MRIPGCRGSSAVRRLGCRCGREVKMVNFRCSIPRSGPWWVRRSRRSLRSRHSLSEESGVFLLQSPGAEGRAEQADAAPSSISIRHYRTASIPSRFPTRSMTSRRPYRTGTHRGNDHGQVNQTYYVPDQSRFGHWCHCTVSGVGGGTSGQWWRGADRFRPVSDDGHERPAGIHVVWLVPSSSRSP